MKRLIRTFGVHINAMQGAWWLFWEEVFLKHHMYRAFDWCSHNFNMANQNARLYRRETTNW